MPARARVGKRVHARARVVAIAAALGALTVGCGWLVGVNGDVTLAADAGDAGTDSGQPADDAQGDAVADARGQDATPRRDAEPDAPPDANDPALRCGAERCAGNDVCCLHPTPSCGGLPCANGVKYAECIGVDTCGPRGGGVCCLTAGQYTSCAAACAGVEVCVATSDCTGAKTCTGSDTSLGITLSTCQ